MISSNPSENKLKRTNVGTFGLFFQGLGQEAPIAIFIGSVTGAAAFALGATPLAFVIGMVASLLSGNSVYQLSKKISHAGGYAAYVNRGLGKHLGVFSGYLFILYELVGPAFIILIYFWTFSSSINAVAGSTLPDYIGIVFIAVALIIAYIVVYRGLKLSVFSLTIIGLVQFAVVFIISSVLLVKSPVRTLTPFLPTTALDGWHGVFLGFITGSYGAYAGYGSIVPLGEEVKSPRKSIGRAVLLIIVVMGLTYIFATYAMVSAWGISSMSSFSQSGFPGAILAGKFLASYSESLVIALYDAVIFTPLVAMLTAGSRMIFSMSRQKLLPTYLSSVHKKFGTPSKAITFLTVLVSMIVIIDGAIFWLKDGFEVGIFFSWIILEIIWSLSTLLIHVFVNSSLSVQHKGKFSISEVITHIVFPTVATIIILLAIGYSLVGISMPIMLAPIILVIYALIVVVMMIRQRSTIRTLRFEEMGDVD